MSERDPSAPGFRRKVAGTFGDSLNVLAFAPETGVPLPLTGAVSLVINGHEVMLDDPRMLGELALALRDAYAVTGHDLGELLDRAAMPGQPAPATEVPGA